MPCRQKNAVRIRVKPVAVGAAIPRAVRSKEPRGPCGLGSVINIVEVQSPRYWLFLQWLHEWGLQCETSLLFCVNFYLSIII